MEFEMVSIALRMANKSEFVQLVKENHLPAK